MKPSIAIIAALALLLSGCAAGGAATPQIIYVTPAPTETPYDAPADIAPGPTAPPAVTIPKTFAKLTARDWAKVVKAPDSYIGKGYLVWACIYQFDAATGPEGFGADAWYTKTSAWYNADNATFTGTAAKLADFVEGDMVYMSVVGTGAYSYDTQAGGNTTVPSFFVAKISRKGSC